MAKKIPPAGGFFYRPDFYVDESVMSQPTACLSCNVSLQSLNTFGLPARAAWFAALETPA